MTGSRWALEGISQSVSLLLPGFVMEVLPEIDSTNSELIRRARAGRDAPTLLVAEAQTAGRGRLGRNWQDGAGQPGSALKFSLGLPLAPADWSGLSLAVGLAVAESLHPEIRLKWPNDLWWQGRKLAGILVETAGAAHATGRFVVIGIGINIEPLEGQDFSTRPAWLQALDPSLDAPAALARIALPLVRAVRAFERHGFAPLAERFNERDAFAGLAVRLSDGTEGQALGVAANGALRVRTRTELREIISSEVSVRPLLAAGDASPAPSPFSTPSSSPSGRA
ncbi:biotin--[acetyl-CoA-carboxylase] ligase [Ottowia thiooxydans]|uniref:biotin--[acetyl-CoA-carboxylase] ligase n=1 Tax=Ottowia thiooxydans TaxID=219182 RepID=UPI000687DA07|nr:biotin--[acetyl-CoA-carboxylase] ligase [Ottowia thiooxydans]